jgi:hypothetical protein
MLAALMQWRKARRGHAVACVALFGGGMRGAQAEH